MEAYPVRIEAADLAAVGFGVLLLGTAIGAATAAGVIGRK